MIDLTSHTDEELSELRSTVGAEQERRERIATIPSQIAALRDRYTADGGNPADLPSTPQT